MSVFFSTKIMKVSESKRSRWVYGVLILMIAALILFSILPLATSIWQQNQAQSLGGSSSEELSRRLESQALGYQLVLEREPDNVNAWQGLLDTRLQQGDLTAAIAPLEQLAQLQPDQVEYTLLLAQTKQQLQDDEGAANIYRNLLQNKPFDIRTLKGLSDLFLVQNKSQEAILTIQNAITQAIKVKANDPSEQTAAQLTSLQLLLGEIYLQQKRFDDAIALYDTASQINSEDFRPILSKALVLDQSGQKEAAEPLFQQALLLAPVQYKDTIKKMVLGTLNHSASKSGTKATPNAPTVSTQP